MALCGHVAGRTSTLYRQCSLATTPPFWRTLTTRAGTRALPKTLYKPSVSLRQQKRPFTRSATCRVASQEAPNAKAYLESGVILGGRDLVDVKKVLVIGSGGLSIGQAGEFDYSGMMTLCPVYFAPSPLLDLMHEPLLRLQTLEERFDCFTDTCCTGLRMLIYCCP